MTILPLQDRRQNAYQENSKSKRRSLVDKDGNLIDNEHPLPVDITKGSITIDTLEQNIGDVGLLDEDENPITIQNPLRVNGDSVYCKDINSDNSDIGTFTGTICSLVNDYDVEITDVTATNPKIFTIRFNRPITTTEIGIGSKTGDFSNVKIFLNDLSGTTRRTIDDSTNNTKYPSNVYSFNNTVFIEAIFEFHTSDPVKLNGIFIPKLRNVVSDIRLQKPDESFTYMQGTTTGNAKMSLEELETDVVNLLNKYPSGTGSNGNVTLTNANIAYAIPSIGVTNSCIITLQNQSDTTIFIGYENSNADGMALYPTGDIEIKLGPGEQIYTYCASAGKIIHYTLKEVQ